MKMATLFLQEDEILAEKVKVFPVLHDKRVKGFEEKDAVQNAWENRSPEQRAEGASSPSKFSVNVSFFSDEPFKCALFERSNPKYT